MKITSLHLYPIKGVTGWSVSSAMIEPRGLAHDRRYLFVDNQNRFLTQRELPQLARIKMSYDAGVTRLMLDDNEPLVVSKDDFSNRTSVTIWKSTVDALISNRRVNDVLSAWLGRPVKLAFQDETAVRLTSTSWIDKGAPVSFADGYPILAACTASLDALNLALCERAQDAGAAVPMNRFRPNIVIETKIPWIEDTWTKLKIGDVELQFIKPCDRCVVVTQDQETGASMGNEPTATLMKMRRSAHPDMGGVLFGWNTVPTKLGSIAVGDEIKAKAGRPEGWPLHSA